jgi:prolyl oligopeptidase
MRRNLLALGLAIAAAMTTHPAMAQESDPYLWLEEINGERALAWVREQSTRAEKEFAADKGYEALRADLLAIVTARERIPFVTRMGEHYYNFWRDGPTSRGVWRRTTLAEYRTQRPKWETVFDLDALAAHEGENWVWKGAECLRPEKPDQPYRRCILQLSRGGSDAVVLREFDLEQQRLIIGADSFVLGEDKQSVTWKDIDTVWSMSAFSAEQRTVSGYSRIVSEWKRGTLASRSPIVFEAKASDDGAYAFTEHESGSPRHWWVRDIAYWNSEFHVLVDDKRDSKPVRLAIPADAQPHTFRDWLLIQTRTPWTVGGRTYAGGSLLAIRFDLFLKGSRSFDELYTPDARSSLDSIATTRNAVLLTELDNVRSRLWELRHDGENWQRTRVPTPDNAQVGIADTYWGADDYLLTMQDFTMPTTLFARSVGGVAPVPLKSLPAFFRSDGLQTQQFEAVSRDGTRIPYFIVMRRGTELNGRNPTLLYGYGGFGYAQLPFYSGVFGKGWLEPGGVFVLANLRGGGEFGPQWHRAAQKENKQRTWDDFIAVAEDLIKRGVTSPRHLGIMGGSQGGLLVTTVMVQRPELFGAAVAQVPLTDMLRFNKLLTGPQWIAEYGDPDLPAERAYIEKYSPYQNVKKDAPYPRLFIVTSTRDDRVHPGHARKLAARMLEQGHDVLYFENIEGGHSAGADNAQQARMWAQSFSFLWRSLAPR